MPTTIPTFGFYLEVEAVDYAHITPRVFDTPHTGVQKTRSSDLPYNSSVLRLHALRGMHVPEYCIARVIPET